MHPVKFSRWCPLFFPTQATRRCSFVRESGGVVGVSHRGDFSWTDPPGALLGTLPFTGVFGHPTCTPEFFHDAPTASRAGASSTWTRPGAAAQPPTDGRLPAAAAAPDAARPAQPSIDNPGRAASPPENIFKVKATIIYTGTSNMDKINSGRLQQVTIGLGR